MRVRAPSNQAMSYNYYSYMLQLGMMAIGFQLYWTPTKEYVRVVPDLLFCKFAEILVFRNNPKCLDDRLLGADSFRAGAVASSSVYFTKWVRGHQVRIDAF